MIGEQPEWTSQANCIGVDPDVFFPEPHDVRGVVAAKLVCSECPVRPQCETHHLAENYGIFGGRTPDERKELRAGNHQPWKPPHWITCPHCERDVPTLNPHQRLCGSDTCYAADRRKKDRARRPPGSRSKAS